jgi:hypothetical protein
MSPELRADFERQWAELATRLDRFLANRRVAPCLRDDLIQETALRLYASWTTVDRTRSPWPLTATIALNLLRDNGRSARNRELFIPPPETASSHEVEASGLARIELARVATALDQLPPSQRAALLRELGMGAVSPTSPDAEKMLRLRARKKLRSLVERVSGILVLRPRRDPSDVNTALMAKEGVAQIATCFACAVLGVAAGVMPGLLAPPRAEAALPRRTDIATGYVSSRTAVSTSAFATPVRTTVPARRVGSERRVASGTRTATSPAGAPVDPGITPLPNDVPLEPPVVEPPTVEPPGIEPPAVPEIPTASPPGDGPTTVPSDLVGDVAAAIDAL